MSGEEIPPVATAGGFPCRKSLTTGERKLLVKKPFIEYHLKRRL